MRVRDIMSSDVTCCTADMTLQQAARMMAACNCGAIPVVHEADRAVPLGIITDRDLACRGVAEGKNPQKTSVADCMTVILATVAPDATVKECCEIMEEKQVRRLLVTDKQGHLCGIVSQADVALHAPQDEVAEVVKKVSEPIEMPSAV
jgi:CBS domain-containing protein